jgi:hypothetical protein
MQDKSTWVVWALILVVGGFFARPLFDRMRNEITVYTMFCPKSRVNGVCASDEQTSIPTSYKAFPDQQSVIYWTGDGAPTRFPSCAVRDVSNWRCQIASPGEAPRIEYLMSDGNFTEVARAPMIASTELFYPVSRWHWWTVKLSEMLAGKK